MITIILPGDSPAGNTIAVLGDFDGVHRAHRSLIEKAVALAKEKNLKSLVYTFEKSKKRDLLLTSNEEKKKIFEELGVDILAFQRVTPEFFKTSPEEFAKEVVAGKLKASYVIIGENYTFGKNGAGTSADMKRLLKEYGVECEISELVQMDSRVISSTGVRNFLKNGDIKGANSFLGRRFSLSGKVIHGNRIGNTIGFPTVNIKPQENEMLPEYGVYAVFVTLDGKVYPGIANVGIKPTVGGKIPLVETNIFGIEGDFYGKTICVEFEGFIRKEKKFSELSELKKQIEDDKIKAKEILKI